MADALRLASVAVALLGLIGCAKGGGDSGSPPSPPSGSGNQAPVAAITAPADAAVSIAAGGSVTFGATCTDPDGHTPVTHAWDFAGGATSSAAASPGAVVFASAGTFAVTYRCTDALGLASGQVTRTITVSAASPTAYFPEGYDELAGRSWIEADQGGGLHLLLAIEGVAEVRYGHCTTPCASAADWTITPIGTKGIGGGRPVLAVTADGRPRAVWIRPGGPGVSDAIVYAECNAGCTSQASWSATDLVDASPYFVPNSRWFAVDAEGRSWLVVPAEQTVFLLRQDSTGDWTVDQLPIAGSPMQVSLALDGVRPGLLYELEADVGKALLYGSCEGDCSSPFTQWQSRQLMGYSAGAFVLRYASGAPRALVFSENASGSETALQLLRCDGACASESAAWVTDPIAMPATAAGRTGLDLRVRDSGLVAIVAEGDWLSYTLGRAVHLLTCAAPCASGAWVSRAIETPEQLDQAIPMPSLCGPGGIGAWFVGSEPALAVASGTAYAVYDGVHSSSGGTCEAPRKVTLARTAKLE